MMSFNDFLHQSSSGGEGNPPSIKGRSGGVSVTKSSSTLISSGEEPPVRSRGEKSSSLPPDGKRSNEGEQTIRRRSRRRLPLSSGEI